jgi:hypothetical protein
MNDGLIAGAGQAFMNDTCRKTGKTVGEGIYCTPVLATAMGYT